MDEYYRDRFGRRHGRGANEGERKSVWLAIADIAAAAISVIAALALLMIFTGQFISPDRFWYFSLAGLVAPAVYVVAVAAMLYWIIRWKWFATMTMALFVACGLMYVPLYYKIDVSKSYEKPAGSRSDIKVLTFNLRHLHQDDWQPSIDSVKALIAQQQPDIICFQEFPAAGELHAQAEAAFAAYRPSGAMSSISRSDCAVECFSRYDIIKADSIGGMAGTGAGIRVDMKIGEDTVRVYNIHLQTTSVSPLDNKYISNREFMSDTTREQRFRDMARGLLDNSKMRARQAECIYEDMHGCRYPIILCGDFNDVPMSYAYRKATRGLYDTFSRKGHNYAHSYRGLFNLLRIDYIMVSPRFETVAYDIPFTEVSDHYPVTATLRLTEKRQ